MRSSSVSSDFTDNLLNFENTSLADNEIASLIDTIVLHEEPSLQTSFLYTVTITVIPKITSTFTTAIPSSHPSFNPLLQQETPIASEATTSFPALLDFSLVFRFNKRITNLEKDLSEMKQVDQYECREEALSDKREYIDLIDTSQNVTESLEAVVLAKSSSQPKSTYEAAASLSEFELIKILMDKIEEHKSYLRADYKRELYDALVKSYNTDKDLFDTYGEVFTLKRSQDDKDKDQYPSAGSERGTKRRKSSKDAESYRDPKSKESKQHVDFRPPQTWISNIACAEKPPTSFDELMDTLIDFSAFVMNQLNITNLTQELLDYSSRYYFGNKDGIPAKEEMEQIKQVKGSCYDLVYRSSSFKEEHQSDTKVFTMTMEILLEPTSNKLCGRFLPRRKFNELARYLQDIMMESLPKMVDECIKKILQTQGDPHDDAHTEGENSAKRQKTSEHGMFVFRESSSGQDYESEPGPSTSGNQDQSNDFDFWTNSYATDDDVLSNEKLLQELVDEMSETVDEAKLCKAVNEMKEIILPPYQPKPTLVVQSCQRDLKAPALSLFPAVRFPDNDIEERTSRWELGHEHKSITEIVVRRANGCIVSITKSDYKNLNKNDIEDMYLLIINHKVDDYAETGLLSSLSIFIKST
ncbi:hypothetical protein Tco_0008200, partial [Tanacetum coccineum]